MMDWLLSVVWYGSFLAAVLGFFALLQPINRLRLSPRWRGAALLAVAVVLIVENGRRLPAETRVATPATTLDMITPAYRFREVHIRPINAPPPRVLAAIKSVTVGEIALFQTLTAIRRLGQSGPPSILNAPEHLPILRVATQSGFWLLADTDREVVIGSMVVAPPGLGAGLKSADALWFQRVSDPRVVKATMNFLVEPEGKNRSRVTTETRVSGTGEESLRQFTRYWRTIFPGSWILRVTWLDAIAKRAQG